MTSPKDIRDDLQAYLDGELTPERATAVRAALDRDPGLLEIAAELETVDRLLEQHPQMVGTPEFFARVQRAAHAEINSSARPWWRSPWCSGLAAASLLVAAVLIWSPFTAEGTPVSLTPPDDFQVLEAGPDGELEQLVTDIEWISEEFLPLD